MTFQEDLDRGRWDVPFFAKRFLDIDLHPGQVRFVETVRARNQTGWRAAYLTICVSAGNRAGKSLALAVVILHSCLYKIGTRPPEDNKKDLDRWLRSEYHWFAFAIQQEISELVFWELVKIMQGSHEAQKSGVGCPLSNEVPNIASWDRKYNGEYRWFVLSPVVGGAEVHFRTTGERALGSLGRDMHGISFDECGFEPRLEFIYGEVLNLRRMGTGGQVLLVSTPTDGITAFADYWETGNPDAPDRKRDRYSIRMSTRENVGYGLDKTTFERLLADMPEELIPQNIDGYFIEGRSNYFLAASVDKAFVEDLPEMQPAQHKHLYVQGVDWATRGDASWSIVLDCTNPNRIVGVSITRLRGNQSTDSIVALTSNSHHAYNVSQPDCKATCSTAIDATGSGGKMFKEALGNIHPLRGVEFGGVSQRKLKMLGDLRTMLDQGKLVLPRHGLWLQLRRELAGYKLADRSIVQDAVMALVCAVSEARRSPGEGAQQSVSFNPYEPDDAVPARAVWVR